MTTFVNAVEYIVYALAAIGIVTASYGIYSVADAFRKKQYLLLRDHTPETNKHRSAHP